MWSVYIKFMVLCLLDKLNNWDDRGIRDLYRRFYSHVLAFISSRVGQKEMAEDLLQEVFLAFLKQMAEKRIRFESLSKVKNYLLTIAMNKVRDYYRKNSVVQKNIIDFKDTKSLSLYLEQLSTGQTPENEFLHKEHILSLQKMVAGAMAVLNEKDAEILYLRFTKNMSVKALAKHLGIRHKAAEAKLFRARASFKAAFEQVVIEQNMPRKGLIDEE